MPKFVLLFCLALFLSACSAGGGDNLPSGQSVEPSLEKSSTAQEPTVYIPDHPLTQEETIEQFFEQQYQAYTGLHYIDVSYLLDMSQMRNRNPLIWLEILIQRRRLIAQHQLCYVETTKYPYRITYEEEAEDGRMEFWSSRGIHNEDEVIVHFTITGEKGRAYPPFLAINGQHTMRLKQIGGVWKITFHYYPGSSRFRQNTPLVLPSEEEMREDLMREFQTLAPAASSGETSLPAHASPYHGLRAVQYARTYTETRNPAFYGIEDFMGNCSNFLSQCLWYGFGSGDQPDIARRENMTAQWYAGQGGGSPAWESVEQFWNYATASRNPGEQSLYGEVVETISQLDPGGIVQTRPGRFRNTDEEYSHSLLLVDAPTLLLAQNSPDCFVYYSDLANTDARFFNPRYLISD
ncbi:amidase domain-containing protein [Candidatus Formimonas warabiya]|uniref:Putative amidase domain-containing protein n=1 Tax=Formimonas warabiya TaxID=1761012 RepID=A0A3G1KYU4_FORW1|nr:amidase domain-containing protein [Candidatus Formimonas warabiya]ATW27385.1 hypothetical protein DCMF_23875 [Candidatus Formimonas warabiya]